MCMILRLKEAGASSEVDTACQVRDGVARNDGST